MMESKIASSPMMQLLYFVAGRQVSVNIEITQVGSYCLKHILVGKKPYACKLKWDLYPVLVVTLRMEPSV